MKFIIINTITIFVIGILLFISQSSTVNAATMKFLKTMPKSKDIQDFDNKHLFGFKDNNFKKAIKESKCQSVTTQGSFDLASYTSAPWYSHMQSTTGYQPIEDNYCTKAEYTLNSDNTVAVHNYANTGGVNQNSKTADLCAYIPDASVPSKLAVGPCFVSKAFYGPYWVIAYDENEGYALISGGQPFIRSGKHGDSSGCRTMEKTMNYSGLWVFTRSPTRDQAVIDKVLDIAMSQGFDISVLNDVEHEGCQYEEKNTKNKYGDSNKDGFSHLLKNYGNN